MYSFVFFLCMAGLVAPRESGSCMCQGSPRYPQTPPSVAGAGVSMLGGRRSKKSLMLGWSLARRRISSSSFSSSSSSLHELLTPSPTCPTPTACTTGERTPWLLTCKGPQLSGRECVCWVSQRQMEKPHSSVGRHFYQMSHNNTKCQNKNCSYGNCTVSYVNC